MMGKWDVTSMHKEIDMSITDKQLTDIQARIDAATHEFLPVNGHPDDDECTNRADGTDDTYCGEPEAAHDVIPDEFSLDLADLLAEVHRLRDELAKAREVTEEKAERVLHAVKPYVFDRLADMDAEDMAWDATRAALGGGDDA